MDLCYVQAMLSKTSVVFSVLNSNGAVLIEPSKKINKTFYKCDKCFHLEPILEMFKSETCFGIIFITGKRYEMYKIIESGTHIESKKIASADVDLPNKHRKGGQSSVRFARLHDEREATYIKQIGELAVRLFMSNNNTQYLIEKLAIVGPGDKKNMLAQDDLVKKYFKNNLIIQNIPDLTEQTISETISKSKQWFKASHSNEEDDIITYVNHLINNNIDKLLFGLDEIKECLKTNEIEQLIITKEFFESFEFKESINCKLSIMSTNKLEQIGLEIIGIKWY